MYMKKNYCFIIIFLLSIVFIPKNTFALTSSEYKSIKTCSNYEVVHALSDGNISHVGCYNTFDEAHSVVEGGDDDLITFDERSTTRIVDAKYGLVDLMKSTVNFYESSSLTTRKYMAVTGLSSFKCADSAFIRTNSSNNAAYVRVANFTGWIPSSDFEIVPLTWVKSKSYYVVSSDTIEHYVSASIQDNSNVSSFVIGPKPDMLDKGTYYTYDGHYFYTTLKKMLNDYKNNTYSNSVNSNDPYYNYYMYLSVHSKTTYSSYNIDSYIKSLGYDKSVYGDKAFSGTSKLYGQGTYFYNSQQKYGVNAVLSLALSKNETGNGRSELAILKNNGFGLDAVDSNPYEEADFFPTFASSIYEYASRYITYGIGYATDYRYFGPAFGDKQNGVQVKYATDAYWSEKMASNYYYFDKYYGFNDFNYYQLGIVTKQTNAYNSDASKVIYTYPEAGDQLLIVGESGNYYKVMSDINIDSNGNYVGSLDDYLKDYNWNTSYVYVLKSDVKLINKGKNGYVDPSNVTSYKDKDYKYDLYVENATLKPRVAKLISDATYYSDASLVNEDGGKVLKDKLVMVYSAAYNSNGKIVSYLITSDYFYDQKRWVSADKISFISSDYGKQTVNYTGQYEWVCSEPIDSSVYKISGFYTNTYFPIIEEVNGWYKVPVSLNSNSNNYGYVLKSESGASVSKYTYISSNNAPVISANNKEIKQGDSIDLLSLVKATDNEDGDITSKVKVSGSVDTNKVGSYEIVYSVVDSGNLETTKTITITVIKDEDPVINASDKEVTINTEFDALDGVSATDKEDGDLTKKIKVIENTVDITKEGEYKIIYQVTDSYGNKTEKEIKVTVLKDQDPVINVSDKQVFINSKFDELNNVTATDKEDGDLTCKIKVIENTVDTSKIGTYKVVYQVTDSNKNKTTKEITVEVVEKELISKEGEFYLNSLNFNSNTNKYEISGYLIVLGVNNTDSSYKLILKNQTTNKEYSFNISSWTNNVPFSLGSENGNNYDDSWFKGSFDMSDVPNGDYDIYMYTEKGDYYSKTIVSNLLNKDIDRRVETSDKGYSFKVNLALRSKKVELSIRDNLITSSTSPTFRNMVNDYDEMDFKDNKLFIQGTSYNYGGTYSDNSKIERKLILENTSTYKRYSYDIESKKDLSYKVTSSDNKDKSYAWYSDTVDIDNLEKGTYSIIVYTKTVDAEDYGQVNDMFGMIKDKSVSINNKKYTISMNKNKSNTIELIVE